MNSDSGMVNTDSGKCGKVFTLNQNGCSRSSGIGVHVEPEWVFTMGRNTHLLSIQEKIYGLVDAWEGVDDEFTSSVLSNMKSLSNPVVAV